MSCIFPVGADEIVEQLMIQCWLFEAREADRAGARLNAERALERLLALGLPHENGPNGPRFDPYAAANMIKTRAGLLDDESWHAWQRTTRRNATSLQPDPGLYEFTLRREWHQYAVTPGRPVVLRMPLPIRGAQRGSARVSILAPSGTADVRESAGRVEIRLDPGKASGPVVAQAVVRFVAGESSDPQTPAATLGEPVAGPDELWLRDREGLVVMSPAVSALADKLSHGCRDARQYAHAAWRWLISQMRFGDWHRSDMDATDPLGWAMQTRVADCVLGSSLLAALCRARGIPARLLTGYLLHPANIGPHSWAEIRLAPDTWVPFDFGSWCYCAGNVDDPEWGNFYRGRTDARFVAEVAPREFTGWGSAPPPERWFRLESLDGDRIVHTLHTLPGAELFRRDTLDLRRIGPAPA